MASSRKPVRPLPRSAKNEGAGGLPFPTDPIGKAAASRAAAPANLTDHDEIWDDFRLRSRNSVGVYTLRPDLSRLDLSRGQEPLLHLLEP